MNHSIQWFMNIRNSKSSTQAGSVDRDNCRPNMALYYLVQNIILKGSRFHMLEKQLRILFLWANIIDSKIMEIIND